jgi:hypothetical protein
MTRSKALFASRTALSLMLSATLSGASSTLCAGWQASAAEQMACCHDCEPRGHEAPPVQMADCCAAGERTENREAVSSYVFAASLQLVDVVVRPSEASPRPALVHPDRARPLNTHLLLSVFLI